MRNIKLIHLWYLLDSLNPGNGIYVLYLTQVLGSATLGMTIVGLDKLTQAICEVPTGILSDKIGRRKTFILMTIAILVGTAIYAFGTTFLVLAVGSIVAGLSRAFFSGSVDAYVYESLKDEGKVAEFGKYTAKLNGTWQTGMIASTIIGAILTYFFGLKTVMVVGLIPIIPTLAIGLLLTNPKSYKVDESLTALQHLVASCGLIWSDMRLRTLTLTNILEDTIGDSGYNFRNIFVATLWPIWATNLSLLINKILGAIGFALAYKYVYKVGSMKALLQSVAYSRIIRLFSTVFPTPFSPVLIQSGQIGYGVEIVAIKKLQQEYFTDRQRATLGSIESFGTSLLISIVSPLIGIMSDATNPATALAICYAIQLAGVCGYVRLGKILTSK